MKLKRLIRYLYGTKERELILGAKDITVMQVLIDAAYAVHANMRSHTGGCILFGRGALIAKFITQKLSTKSSTEAELVGCSDYLPLAILARKFLEQQGYDIQPSILLQDNQSTIRLFENGRASAGKQSRHIDIRYFFVKDRIDKEEFKVEHCPTEKMIAIFFTKPLQGKLFHRLSVVIMGEIDLETFNNQINALESKERVAPTTVPNKNNPDDDVNIDVDTNNIDRMLKKPLPDEVKKKNKVSYADVVKIKPTK